MGKCFDKFNWERALGPSKALVNTQMHADDTAFIYSKSDQATDLWKQLEMATGLEYGLRDTMDLGRNWIVDLNARKTFFFRLTGLIAV